MGKSQETTMMDIYHWCHEASRYICFKPDRVEVYQELLAHIFDKVNDFENCGMKREEAMKAAVEEMGDATEIGLMMRKIHKPYLGYLWRVTQVLLVLSFLLIFYVCRQAGGIRNMIEELKPQKDYWEQNREVYDRDSAYELVADLTPNCEARIDGYQLSIPKVVHWKFEYEEDGKVYQSDTFKFIVKAKHSPFLDAPKGILEHLTAIDNLGNYYTDVSGYTRGPSVVGNLTVKRLFSSQFEMWVDKLSPDAEWIELQYDFLGRSFRLRIPTIGRGTYD
ncbi:permease prefix domain 1-containing protein [Lachnoclostridium phytofermentans]|nr:permease prefix domain 1-containing protein [Lachnoclostridium phytofermentans]